jgi:hypothetical protein
LSRLRVRRTDHYQNHACENIRDPNILSDPNSDGLNEAEHSDNGSGQDELNQEDRIDLSNESSSDLQRETSPSGTLCRQKAEHLTFSLPLCRQTFAFLCFPRLLRNLPRCRSRNPRRTPVLPKEVKKLLVRDFKCFKFLPSWKNNLSPVAQNATGSWDQSLKREEKFRPQDTYGCSLPCRGWRNGHPHISPGVMNPVGGPVDIHDTRRVRRSRRHRMRMTARITFHWAALIL